MSNRYMIFKHFFGFGALKKAISNVSGPAGVLSALAGFGLTAVFGSITGNPIATLAASTGTATLLLVFSVTLYDFVRSIGMVRFFRFKKDREFVVVLPTFHIWKRPDAKPDEHPEGLYKISREGKHIEGVTPWIRCTAYDDLILVNQIRAQISKTPGVTVFLTRDDEVVVERNISAPYYDGSKPLVCFGSSQFNDLAQLMLRNLKTDDIDSETISFTSSEMILNKVLSEVFEAVSFSSNDETDYGLLARVTIFAQYDPVTCFICAGIDAPGTHILTNYLLSSWPKLYKYFGTNDFFAVYKFSKQNYELHYKTDALLKPINDVYFTRSDGGLFVPQISLRRKATMLEQLISNFTNPSRKSIIII